jgi:hypothetical protein
MSSEPGLLGRELRFTQLGLLPPYTLTLEVGSTTLVSLLPLHHTIGCCSFSGRSQTSQTTGNCFHDLQFFMQNTVVTTSSPLVGAI